MSSHKDAKPLTTRRHIESFNRSLFEMQFQNRLMRKLSAQYPKVRVIGPVSPNDRKQARIRLSTEETAGLEGFPHPLDVCIDWELENARQFARKGQEFWDAEIERIADSLPALLREFGADLAALGQLSSERIYIRNRRFG